MILGGRLCEQSAIALVSDTIIHHHPTIPTKPCTKSNKIL